MIPANWDWQKKQKSGNPACRVFILPICPPNASHEPAQHGRRSGKNMNREFQEGARILPAIKISGEAGHPHLAKGAAAPWSRRARPPSGHLIPRRRAFHASATPSSPSVSINVHQWFKNPRIPRGHTTRHQNSLRVPLKNSASLHHSACLRKR